MKISSLNILTDENVSPRVVSFLRQKGINVVDVKEKGWHGREDVYLLKRAYDDKRFIVTHDSDFGTLAINEGAPCYGIIYLRLRNLKVFNIISVLEKLLHFERDIAEGSLIVVEEARVRIRKV
jgi:predicted nuclease of predicted toxin-antitoxin system